MEKCLACGRPKGSWDDCDRWDCPLLLLKDTIYRDNPPQKEIGDGGIECVPLDELYGR